MRVLGGRHRVLGGGFGLVGLTRFFTTLVASGSMHYTIPEVALTGHFEITFKLAATATALGQKIMDGTTDRMDLNYSVGGVLDLRAYGTWYVDGAQTNIVPQDNKIHDIRFSRTASESDQGTKRISFVGCRFSLANFLNGIIANLSITDAGTLSRFYPLNENFGETTIVKNSLAVLGANISHTVLVNTFIVSGSTDLGSLPDTLTTDFIPVTGGEDYLVEANGTTTRSRWQWTDDGGATVFYGAATLNPSAVEGANGVITPPATATHIRIYFKQPGDNATDISVKQADGYGTAVNISESDLFTLQSNGDYLGVEQVINGNFSSPVLPSEWTFGNATGQIVNSEFKVTTTNINHNAKYGITEKSGIYMFNFLAKSSTQAVLKYSVFNSTTATTIIPATTYSLGEVSVKVDTPAGVIQFYPLRDSGATGVTIFDNVSVKQLLERA